MGWDMNYIMSTSKSLTSFASFLFEPVERKFLLMCLIHTVPCVSGGFNI